MKLLIMQFPPISRHFISLFQIFSSAPCSLKGDWRKLYITLQNPSSFCLDNGKLPGDAPYERLFYIFFLG
jgi:hypothetical protein